MTRPSISSRGPIPLRRSEPTGHYLKRGLFHTVIGDVMWVPRQIAVWPWSRLTFCHVYIIRVVIYNLFSMLTLMPENTAK